jgi:hypothetical protein
MEINEINITVITTIWTAIPSISRLWDAFELLD